MDVYDPGTAFGDPSKCYFYGNEPAVINYVGVNSCLTLTFCYPGQGQGIGTLWGVHFAVKYRDPHGTAENPDAAIDVGFVTRTMTQLFDIGPIPDGPALDVWVVGNPDIWASAPGGLKDAFDKITEYAKARLPSRLDPAYFSCHQQRYNQSHIVVRANNPHTIQIVNDNGGQSYNLTHYFSKFSPDDLIVAER